MAGRLGKSMYQELKPLTLCLDRSPCASLFHHLLSVVCASYFSVSVSLHVNKLIVATYLIEMLQ